MTVEWCQASNEVIHIAQELVNQHHTRLLDANIGFLFRSEAQESGGRTILAQTSTVPAKMQKLMNVEYEFIIWIAEDEWNKLTTDQRRALIDHELCHILVNEMREGDISHEERVVTGLTKAFLWTAADVEKEAKNGSTVIPIKSLDCPAVGATSGEPTGTVYGVPAVAAGEVVDPGADELEPERLAVPRLLP
jgi:predicted metallopeptidase